MTISRQREIIIEVERLQVIRKRAKTTLQHCAGCGGGGDFVALYTAAHIFSVSHNELAAFVRSNMVHTEADNICVRSLLAAIRARKKGDTRSISVCKRVD